jgi:hypothetical protein
MLGDLGADERQALVAGLVRLPDDIIVASIRDLTR